MTNLGRGLTSIFIHHKLGKDPDPDQAETLAQLLQAAREGHLCVRYEGPELPGTVKDGNRLYLPRFFAAETRVLEGIRKLGDRLTFLTGGPGTGKTHTSRQWIAQEKSVAIAAPTGKAASNLEGAQTIHALLRKPLTADFVLVDEASMIDVDLMARLLHAIPPHARLVLVGDPDQLPPVEAGSLFADMVDALPSQVTRLTQPMRQENTDLIDLANAINEGRWLETERTDDPVAYAKRHHSDSFIVLTPLRSEVERLNSLLSFEPIPILITKNDYTLDLFNGQVGILKGDTAHFGDRIFPRLTLPPHTPAYCLSVHKSQGSEFDHVLFVAPPGSERFGREILYTAATRAKKRFTLCASDETLHAMLEKHERRLSGLLEKPLKNS